MNHKVTPLSCKVGNENQLFTNDLTLFLRIGNIQHGYSNDLEQFIEEKKIQHDSTQNLSQHEVVLLLKFNGKAQLCKFSNTTLEARTSGGGQSSVEGKDAVCVRLLMQRHLIPWCEC